MPNFWSYIKNDSYAIGCTGQTVYVYDCVGNELARFKDIIYAYTPMFCPQKNMFIVKSTDGRLAVYSLDEMKLIKKIRFSKVDGAQDDGFCFSKDGKYFYNIERHINSCNSCLSIYETSDFKRIKQLFLEDQSLELSYIEYDIAKDQMFVLGFMRGKDRVYSYGFVATFENENLNDLTQISDDEYDYLHGYKGLELMGFTAKAKQWSSFSYADKSKLKGIESKTVFLSDFIKSQ